jgi:hypothetical protein
MCYLMSLKTLIIFLHILGFYTEYLFVFVSGSRGSVVGIAIGYGLDEQGVGVRLPIGLTILFSTRRPDRL